MEDRKKRRETVDSLQARKTDERMDAFARDIDWTTPHRNQDMDVTLYRDLGDRSACVNDRRIGLWCDACRVRWIGCQDAHECPQCGDISAYEHHIEFAQACSRLVLLDDAIAGKVGRNGK